MNAFLLSIAVFVMASFVTAASAMAQKPNIVLILADDLGYGDLHCYNPERGKIPTPNLDKLAGEGLRFTDAHSSSGVCSPSRYTLLTGRYHWRSRLQSGIVGYLEEPLIAADRLTLAGMLKQKGYHTACIGKWHLGWEWAFAPQQRPFLAPGRGATPETTEEHLKVWREVYSKPIGGGPTTRGFDQYFGTDVPNWPPYCFIENDHTTTIPTEFLPVPLLKNHLASIGGPATKGWRLEGILPTLTQRACDYISQRAATKEPFFLYMPLTSPHTPLAPNQEWQNKSGLESRAADLIMETDAAVGRVLEAIEATGTAANTLVIFTSDNGFAHYVGAKELEARGHFPSGPLRGYKADAWEGGHRIPFIVRWPRLVRPGVCDQLIHHADVMATVAEVVAHQLPDNAGEDSFSLMPLLRGEDKAVREYAISHASSGLPSLRKGAWKLIAGAAGGGYAAKNRGKAKAEAAAPDAPAGTSLQLYNLAEDLGEQHNLASDHPELAQELLTTMDKLVTEGRSTPGEPQKNDVPVNWRRFMNPGQAKGKAAKSKRSR